HNKEIEAGTELSIGCKRRTMLSYHSSLQKNTPLPRAANEPLRLRPASLIEAFIPAGVYVFFFRCLHKKRIFKKVYAKVFVFTLNNMLMSQPLYINLNRMKTYYHR